MLAALAATIVTGAVGFGRFALKRAWSCRS
jgi:hypothetical protein